MTDAKDFEIIKYDVYGMGKLNAVSFKLFIADQHPRRLTGYFPHTRQKNALSEQLLAKYPFKCPIHVAAQMNHYLVTVGNFENVIPRNDLVRLQRVEADLEKNGTEHFLPIIAKTRTLSDRAELRAMNWSKPTTPGAVLRELRYLPSVVVDAHFADKKHQWSMSDVIDFLERTMQRLFEENFDWDYKKSNDKLTEDEQEVLRKYINRQVIDLRVFSDFAVILEDLTPDEKVDEKADLKKAVKALRKA